MEDVDNLAINGYEINLLNMMEKAGKELSDFVLSLKPKKIIVAYGEGHNGGGGLVAARYLNMKVDVSLISVSDNLKEATKIQLQKLNLNYVDSIKSEPGLIIVDALLGYSVNRNPEGKYAELINQINLAQKEKTKVISLDLPSGLDATSGETYNPHISADFTVTLALPKTGLQNSKVVGELYLTNIGIPDNVYKELNIVIEDYFKDSNLIKI